MRAFVPVRQPLGDLPYLAVVRAGQRQQADLGEPGRVQAPGHHVADRGDGPLPDRPSDHASLAEPAAAGTTAENLHAHPLVDGLRQRHQRRLRIGPGIQVTDGVFGGACRYPGTVRGDRADTAVRLVAHVVEGRHISEAAPGQPHEQLIPPAGRARGPEGTDHIGDRKNRLLAIPEHDRVDERRDRFGIERGMPADDHNRMIISPIHGMQRDAREIERGQQVGVSQLGGEADAQQVEVADRAVAVHGELRDTVLTQQFLQIRPDRVGTLGQDVRLLVEDLVQDLDTLVGQAYLVGVRIHQTPADDRVRPGLALGIPFAAEVAHGLTDPRQQRFQTGEQRLSGHAREPTAHSPSAERRHKAYGSERARRWTFCNRPTASRFANIDDPP